MKTHEVITKPADVGNDAVLGAPTTVRPPSRAARIGALALVLGFGAFLAWAAFAPLDEGVPTHGTIALDTKRKAVQHPTGGIVREIHVREGDVVQTDQLLFVLDAAISRANYESVRQRYLGLRAMQGRLLAEQAGAGRIDWHPDLLAAQDDPWISSQMMARAKQLLLRHISALAAEGYAPRVRQSELQRQVAELQASLSELQGNIARVQRAIAELQQRAQVRQQDYRKEVEADLTRVNLDVQADAERYVAAKADLDRTYIRAPAAGQVVGLGVQTVGAVIQPGQKLMDIVPENEPLLIEAKLEPHLIDRVREGLKTDIRFSAFSHSPQLVVEGEVISVSKDLLADPHTGVPYYLLRVAVTPQGMQTLGARRLQAGMPAEVIVKTGERSLLTYLLSPLTRRVAASLTEE